MGKDGSVSVKEQTARDGDTLVNTGVVAWPDEDSAWSTVRRMQLKLHRWASEDSARRFGDLFNLVYDPAFLIHAWERVRSNDGARTAGIDGLTVAQIETRVGVHAFLGRVRDLLKSGEYRPSPVRRVKIPKGGGKLRSLGIPTVADRVVQAACKAVLEPVFEADFLPCSYGFRPNRRAQDAIAEIHHFTSRPANYHYVLEADIAACFDEIDHVAVMDRVRRRIKDKRLCNLVKAFLKAGVLTDLGDREESLTGTPQGGILSPLLANIALSVLDEHFTRQWNTAMGSYYQRSQRRRNGLGNWRLVRYADDFVLLVSGDRHHAEALREQVSAVIAPLGLRLAPEKTRVVHIDEGFDFLGFHIRRMRKRGTNKHYVYTTPSRSLGTESPEPGAGENLQINPQRRPGRADHQPEPVSAGVGELLSARGVQSDIQRHRPPRLVATGRMDPPQTPPDQPQPAPTPLLRPGLADRPQRGRVHRRLQRRRDPLPLPRREHPDPLDPHRHQRLSNGQDTWRAGCVETRTSGSAGGHGKRTRGNPDTAPVPDPTAATRRRSCPTGPRSPLVSGVCRVLKPTGRGRGLRSGDEDELPADVSGLADAVGIRGAVEREGLHLDHQLVLGQQLSDLAPGPAWADCPRHHQSPGLRLHRPRSWRC